MRDAHRASRALDDLLGAQARLLELAELAESRLENAGHALRRRVGTRHLAVQRAQVDAGPEARLEFLRARGRSFQHAALVDDDGPRGDRREHQQHHDELHEQARLEKQADDRDFTAHCVNSLIKPSGRRRGLPPRASMHATSAEPSQTTSPSGSSRRTSCAKRMRAPRAPSTSADTYNMSESRAGALKRASIADSTSTMPCSARN